MYFIIFFGIGLLVLGIYHLLKGESQSKSGNYTRPGYSKTPEAIGRQGEGSVRWIIGETVEGVKYVINDLIVENDGRTSQIDHIVINSGGVFVIETKNYSGKIYGSENQHEWTQVLAYGKTKNKLYNPLKQNTTHMYNVKRIVGNLPIYSVVVFVQNNTQHIEAPRVIPLSNLKSYLASGTPILTPEQMRTAYEALINSRSEVSTAQHIANVKAQQLNLELGFCPRCSCKLVVRNGAHGPFWGCSNYPKCKFTKNILNFTICMLIFTISY